MGDIIDHANDNAELFLRAAIANREKCNLKPVSQCHYCNESVKSGALFCASECRDDWQTEQRIRRITGHQE